MIVVRRIWDGTLSHFPIRATEWIMAIPLVGIGWALYLDDQLFSRTPSFAKLAEYGDETAWCIVIMACAICRLLALLINGTFHGFTHSPTIRLGASLIAMTFWSLFTIGVAVAFFTQQGAVTGVIAYGTFMVIELRNIYLSRRDMVLSRAR